MNDFDKIISEMNLAFFGREMHKITPIEHFATADAVVVDLRFDEEYGALALPLKGFAKSLHIPFNQLPDRLNEIPKDKPVGLFCSSDNRSAMAFLYLRAKGYENARILMGGYHALTDALMPGKVFKKLGA